MATTVLDEFITEYSFRVDKSPLRGLEARVDRIRQRLGQASLAFSAVGAGLTGALYGIGRTILGFETEMNALEAATGANADQMAELRAQALELGRTTAFSAAQAAQAQKLLGQAGLETNEILAAMPAVLDLAAAGQLDLAEAAGIVTSQLAAFDLGADSARRVADVLAAAAASAKTTVSDMGVAFRQAAPLAKQLGVPLEEVAAMLATLQNNGLRAESAGVGVRNVMLRLVNPTKEVRDALDTLGVEYDRIADLLNQGRVQDAVGVLADAQLDAGTAAKLFGAESANAALILASSRADIARLTEEYEAAGGAAQRMAETQMQGLPGAVLEFKSALEGAMLALGDAGLTGWMERATDTARRWLGVFSGLPPETRRLVAGVIAAGPALTVFGGALRGVSFALAGFAPLMRLVMGLFTPWGAALSLLSAGATLLLGDWKKVREWFERQFPAVAGFIEDVATRTRATIGGWLETVAARFRETDWSALGEAAAERAQQALAVGLDALAVAVAWMDRMTVAVTGADWAGLGNRIGTWIGDALVSTWRAALDFMAGTAEVDGNDIGQRILRGLIRAIVGATQLKDAVVGGLVDALGGAFRGLGGVLVEAAREELARFVVIGQAIASALIAGLASKLAEFALPDWLAAALVGRLGGTAGLLFAGAGGEGGEAGVLAPGYTPTPAGTAAAGDRTVNQSRSVNVENVNVNVQQGDPETIAAGIADALTEQLHDAAEDWDTDVSR